MVNKVLIVDDNEDILEALGAVFELYEYVVKTEPDGTKAFEQVASFLPDAIVLDMLLSGVNGLTICNSLKLDANTSHIPIVMISAHPGAKQLAESAGANYFMAKPFDVDELVKLVTRSVKESKKPPQNISL